MAANACVCRFCAGGGRMPLATAPLEGCRRHGLFPIATPRIDGLPCPACWLGSDEPGALYARHRCELMEDGGRFDYSIYPGETDQLFILQATDEDRDGMPVLRVITPGEALEGIVSRRTWQTIMLACRPVRMHIRPLAYYSVIDGLTLPGRPINGLALSWVETPNLS